MTTCGTCRCTAWARFACKLVISHHLSLLQVVLVPTFLGALLNQSFPRAVQRASKFTPILATAVVALIIGSTLGQNVVAAKTAGWKLVSAVFVLHSAGFTIGYGVSKVSLDVQLGTALCLRAVCHNVGKDVCNT